MNINFTDGALQVNYKNFHVTFEHVQQTDLRWILEEDSEYGAYIYTGSSFFDFVCNVKREWRRYNYLAPDRNKQAWVNELLQEDDCESQDYS